MKFIRPAVIKKPLILTLVILVAAGISILLYNMIREDSAEEIITRAESLIQMAEEHRQEDYAQTLRYYNRAIQTLETLMEETHTSTQAAQALRSGERTLGNHTVEELRQKVLPAIQRRAEAEENLSSLISLIADNTQDAYYQSLIHMLSGQASLHRKDSAQAMQNMRRALNLVDTITPPYLKIDILTSLAVSFHNLSSDSFSRDILERAVHTLSFMEDTPLRQRLRLSIISAYAAIEEFETAQELIPAIGDSYIRECAYLELVRHKSPRYTDINRAIELTEEITAYPLLRYKSYGEIIMKLMGDNKIEQARNIHAIAEKNHLPEISETARKAYAHIDNEKIRAHIPTTSVSFDQAQNLIHSIDDIHIRIDLLIYLGSTLFDIKETSHSGMVLQTARDLIQELGNSRKSYEKTANLARAYGAAEKFTEAFSLALEINDELLRNRTITETALQHITADGDISPGLSAILNQIINTI
jgi:tetratricopeptide (TPR) repeat protein